MRIKKTYFPLIICLIVVGFAALSTMVVHAQSEAPSDPLTSPVPSGTTTGSTTSTACALTRVGNPDTADAPVMDACNPTTGGVPSGDFVYYCQGNPQWDQSCGIDQAGCGPASLAMIVSTLGAARLSPDRMDAIFRENGWRSCSTGSGSNIGGAIESMFLTSQGLTASPDITGANFISEVKKATIEGGLIIASSDLYPCHCGHSDGSTFPASHIIVIQKVNDDGTFAIRDPSNCDFSTGQEFTQFINVNPNTVAWKWAFAISKVL